MVSKVSIGVDLAQPSLARVQPYGREPDSAKLLSHHPLGTKVNTKPQLHSKKALGSLFQTCSYQYQIATAFSNPDQPLPSFYLPSSQVSTIKDFQWIRTVRTYDFMRTQEIMKEYVSSMSYYYSGRERERKRERGGIEMTEQRGHDNKLMQCHARA